MLIKTHSVHPRGNLSYLMTLGFTAAESTFSAVSSRAGEGNHRGTFDVKEK